jgi:uncharacterized protein YyaL (SSP411 family)
MANRLLQETSPYLLQHAYNPVDWFPWGDEAIDFAKQLDKPILVSIGYAACHWCHVMEKESFEDAATAELMNNLFINIKVDREERPDVDHIYMDALQAMTGSGGWPLNMFLTPEGKPFYGGTYFPPKPMYNRASWKEVLINVHTAFQQKRTDIEAQADNLIKHLHNANNIIDKADSSDALLTKENEQLIADNILKQADKEWGGFGNAPKFPQTFSIQYLLRHYHFTKHEQSLKQALLSLDKMIDGGLYDHLGGGFARYSTDSKWLAPHFEKMLYDNALLVSVLSEAYQLTQSKKYAHAIHSTIQFITTELMNEEGGFFSAIDADSEGVEGKFYTWQKEEIQQLLGEEAELFCKAYNVSDHGNWEHTNILWQPVTLNEVANANEISIDELDTRLATARTILLSHRAQRIRPQTDDKVLLSWNALMVTALCKAYAAMGEENYLELAEKNIQFIEEKMTTKGTTLLHTYKNGHAKIEAFLDDYAYLIQAYIHLQEVTANAHFLVKAQQLTEFVIQHFSDDENTLFYFTHHQQSSLVVRKKEIYDGATPSGNAVMAGNLAYLSIIFNKADWQERYVKMISTIGTAIVRYPTSFGVWAGLTCRRGV